MQLKLKQSITARGEQYRPPSVIDTVKLRMSDREAQVLISRGVAELVDVKPTAEVEAPAPLPELIDAAPVQVAVAPVENAEPAVAEDAPVAAENDAPVETLDAEPESEAPRRGRKKRG